MLMKWQKITEFFEQKRLILIRAYVIISEL